MTFISPDFFNKYEYIKLEKLEVGQKVSTSYMAGIIPLSNEIYCLKGKPHKKALTNSDERSSLKSDIPTDVSTKKEIVGDDEEELSTEILELLRKFGLSEEEVVGERRRGTFKEDYFEETLKAITADIEEGFLSVKCPRSYLFGCLRNGGYKRKNFKNNSSFDRSSSSASSEASAIRFDLIREAVRAFNRVDGNASIPQYLEKMTRDEKDFVESRGGFNSLSMMDEFTFNQCLRVK